MRERSAADQRPSEDYLSRRSFKKRALSWAETTVFLTDAYTGLERLVEIAIFSSLTDSFIGIGIGLAIGISIFFSIFAGMVGAEGIEGAIERSIFIPSIADMEGA
jgi:hypothetical protein